jgi:hypothetical protein
MAFTPAVGHRALKLKVGFGTETDLASRAIVCGKAAGHA